MKIQILNWFLPFRGSITFCKKLMHQGLVLVILSICIPLCANTNKKITDEKAIRRSLKTHLVLPPTSDSIAPSKDFRSIRPSYKYEGQYYDKIEFWEGRSNKPTRVIDLQDINPFVKLPFPITGFAYGCPIYDLSSVRIEELHKEIGDWEIKVPSDRKGFLIHEDTIPSIAEGQILVSDDPFVKDFTIVDFQLYISNSRGDIIAILAHYIVFDCKGNVIGEFRNSLAGNIPIVTQDGKYVITKYGGEYGEDGGYHVEEGFRVFETKTGSLIKEISWKDEHPLRNYYYFPVHDYFVILNSYRDPLDPSTFLSDFFIFPPASETCYKKNLPLLLRPRLTSSDDFGVDYIQHYELPGSVGPIKSYFNSPEFEMFKY